MMTNHTQVALRKLWKGGFEGLFIENIAKICKVNSSRGQPPCPRLGNAPDTIYMVTASSQGFFQIDDEYRKHSVFRTLSDYANFYSTLSGSIMCWMSLGTRSILNLDTYVYSSVEGTLRSILEVLEKGRINDAYSLVRKYFDATVINIYTNLYLEENFSLENSIVDQIESWRTGAAKLPDFRTMSEYIERSPRVAAVTSLLEENDSLRTVRKRCNDHTHYNYYRYVLLNDGNLSLDRKRELDRLEGDLQTVFVRHFAYIFFLQDQYFMSIDYVGALDCGLQPEENSEYWVAPFVQDVFDTVIKVHRPDIAKLIKDTTKMMLD